MVLNICSFKNHIMYLEIFMKNLDLWRSHILVARGETQRIFSFNYLFVKNQQHNICFGGCETQIRYAINFTNKSSNDAKRFTFLF